MLNSIIYKIKSSFIKLPITIAGIATLTFLGTLNIDSAPLTLGLMGIVLISVLIFLRTKSMRRSQMHRQKIKYSLLFIGISALFTILNNYLLLDLFESSIIYKILIFVTMPLIFQMYYKLVLCIQYLTFKEPTQEIDNSFSENQLPGCSVLIATRNEPFDVCKLTFDSANQLHYSAHKKQIIVVDNSDLNHQDLEQWRNYVEKQNTLNPDTEYKFIHRNSTVGFKPKNLDIGMEYLNQPYVILLDADSTLKADTLKRVMPEFIKDKKLRFASLLIKGTNDNSSLFAKICCMSQNMLRYTMSLIGHRGFSIFQGHNSIWSIVGNFLGQYLVRK
ncbi:hypothetical protein fh0823_00350 [Francisella halioticida]|uniref:glycosyltransferase n=1 Tax=Francisella halioticida TaxID=549298 RepID=UPI001AF2D7B9|nr:glycosyltransferase [Francisella halioticida]BCD89896.1 hypothetical protein fh0823_00350 [Francisella halioticida]